jgi:son of sevenless
MAEYAVALHDYVPQEGAATICLAFRARQVIRVFNRDASGWWDGEIDGKRGWFPSNYVKTDSDEEDSADLDEDLTQVPMVSNNQCLEVYCLELLNDPLNKYYI